MIFDNDPSDLTHPRDLSILRDRAIPGGRVHLEGWARFNGVRVHVESVSPRGLVAVNGELPLSGVHNLKYLDGSYPGSRLPLMSGEVSFLDLDRFWLTRTSVFDVIDDETPLPGLLTTIDGTDFGVADSAGTVSLAGVPQLQLVWLDDGEPPGDEWQPDGYQSFTRLVPRDQVPGLRYVEWTAVWRDITVKVAGIRGTRAHIFVERGGLPAVEHPEIRHGANVKSGWSAVVSRTELSLRSWSSAERPVGRGTVIGCVAHVRGRAGVVVLPGDRDEHDEGIIVRKDLGETVTEDYGLYALGTERHSPMEWRTIVAPGDAEEDVTSARRIESAVEWQGEMRAVEGLDEPNDVAFVSAVSAPLEQVSQLRYTIHPVALSDLPRFGWQMPDRRRH
ncbi:hypothetical protein E3O25_14675 [Cryobacterium sp. TMT1-3]|uniref:hypothetical protein n=1 Tax=Cryobacterium sp. TMT1-3 TaxID=1259237 RepID=UPI001069FF25|nr:hypothetical protein [Cryobacterium sp. TMT1-3]TFC24428.1 hypothetical protein E3O25_14675 [Cryobacterium sp. TMT1-3]